MKKLWSIKFHETESSLTLLLERIISDYCCELQDGEYGDLICLVKGGIGFIMAFMMDIQ